MSDMRRLLLLTLAICGCAKATVNGNHGNPDAGSNNPDPDGDITQIDAPDGPGPIDALITQTLTQTTNSQNAMSNSATCGTGDNSWYRVFPLSDHGITGPFNVTQVTFGGQEAAQAPVLQIKIGTYAGTVGGTTLDLAQVTNINSTTLTAPNETDPGANLVAPITGTIPANSNLIVEIFVPNNTTTKFFYIGASNAGETKPGYVRGPGCTVTVPTATGSPPVSLPTANLNITVTGTH
jgi:hypothetical protein